MLSNRNNRHERARHLATRRGVARRIYHSMASLLHCWRFFTSWTDSREVGVVEEVGTLNNHHHRCRRRIRGIRWGGEVVGWICTLVLTYHPTRYHQKIIEFVFWGGVLCNNQNGGLSIATDISFFWILKYIRFSRPRTVWGGNANGQHHVINQQSAIIFLEQSSSLSSHNNKHDGSLGYSNNYW